MEQRATAVDDRFLLEWDPNIGRIAAQGFAEESRWRDPDYGERMAIDHERRTHQGRVGAISGLPNVMAEHSNGRCGRFVVIWCEHPPAKGAHR